MTGIAQRSSEKRGSTASSRRTRRACGRAATPCPPDSRARARRLRHAARALLRRPRLPARRRAVTARAGAALKAAAGREPAPRAGFAANEGSAAREVAASDRASRDGPLSPPRWLRAEHAISRPGRARPGGHSVDATAYSARWARRTTPRSARAFRHPRPPLAGPAHVRCRRAPSPEHEQFGPVSQDGGWPPAGRLGQQAIPDFSPSSLRACGAWQNRF
jgi:hypothetical protein